jgi:TnpA family transposase
VLDGLLYHQTGLQIEEHYSDTGVTDHIFGLCHLFGFRFAPRIREFEGSAPVGSIQRVGLRRKYL